MSYRGKSWAVDQSVGKVDFRDEEQLRRLAASGQLLEAGTMGEAKAATDQMRNEACLAKLEVLVAQRQVNRLNFAVRFARRVARVFRGGT